MALMFSLFFVFTERAAYGQGAVHFDQPRALKTLNAAAEQFDELENVPETSWLRKDRRKIRQNMKDILNEAIAILDIPKLITLRQDYRKLEAAVVSDENAIAELRERRFHAPEGDLTFTTRYIPTTIMRQWTATTRGDYDYMIEAHQRSLQERQNDMKALQSQMSDLLSDIGIELTPEQVEFWLCSVIGDDVLSMSVVFSNIKAVTIQLAHLTRETGENLTYAKRYYGMMVMLHQLVVQMQESFVTKTDNEILPKLAMYSTEADKTILEARRLLREGGTRSSLESNIAANQMTKQAIDLYQRVVRDQRDKVASALVISEREMLVAVNTYKTVKLSSDVTTLIREGTDIFEKLASLQIPAAADFQNHEIRQEFLKLTQRLKQN